MGPEVLPLGHLTRSTRFYRSCNCATHFTWESLPQGVRKGAWARKSCWEPSGWCLLLLSRVKQSLFHRHEDLQEPHEYNAAVRARCQCRNVPGGCTNTPDQSSPALTGASFVRPRQTAPKHFQKQQEYVPATRWGSLTYIMWQISMHYNILPVSYIFWNSVHI